jgi:hypothetical protein
MNKSQPFRQHQLTRALKAAQAAGGANPHVRVVLPNGTQLFLSGGEVQEAPPKKSTPRAGRGSKLAEGGAQHMLGKQAADPVRPGRTGKPQSAADTKQASGGISRAARAGECGT